ncbi:MAG: PQQ-binding-like beta-propeller repeat protein [Blastocatellia bacterium]
MKKEHMLIYLSFLAFALLAANPANAQSQDWPQWGGPQRNFKSDAKGLANSWPATGPRILWSRELGEGYSGISVSGSNLYTMYRKGGQEIVAAIEADTGKTSWEYSYESPFKNSYEEAGGGPYSMPLIVGDQIYTAGATGKLHCLDKRSGKVVWSHDLYKEFNGSKMDFGYSCNPFAYKNLIIMLVGGRGHSIMAFNQKDGSVAWQKQDFANGYSTPVLINVDGQDQIVAFMSKDIVGVDPGNGELLWSHPHTTDNHFAISQPVWGEDNLLFFSSSYGGGSRSLQLTKQGSKTIVKELWHNNRVRVHFSNTVRIGDYIYCSSGHSGPAFFTAINVKTGEIAWQDRSFAKASFLYADGKFIIIDEDGRLGLATATPEGFKVISKVDLLKSNAWTVPSLVGTKLYVRDRKTIMALDLR